MDKLRGKNKAQRPPPSLYSWNCYESVTAHSSDFSREGGGEEETHRNAIHQTQSDSAETTWRPGGTSLAITVSVIVSPAPLYPKSWGCICQTKDQASLSKRLTQWMLCFPSIVTEKWSLTDPDVRQKVRETYETLKKGGTDNVMDVSLLTHQFPNNHSRALY